MALVAKGGEWIPELLAENAEEVGFLWQRRLDALEHPEWNARSLRSNDALLLAHEDALLLAGVDAAGVLQAAWDEAEELGEFVGLGRIRLLAGGEVRDEAFRAFAAAEGVALEGWALALRHTRDGAIRDHLAGLDQADVPAVIRAAAACALAHQDGAPRCDPRVHLTADDPRARAWGFAAVTRLSEGAAKPPLSRGLIEAALGDPSPQVQRRAIEAAAVRGEAFLLEALRARATATEAGFELLLHLAILGEGAPEAVLCEALRAPALGARRFSLAVARGALGEELVAAMDGADPATAVQAASAFLMLTGVDVTTAERVAGPDDESFQGVDVAQARQVWAELGASGARLRHGVAIDGRDAAAMPADADLAGLAQAQLRARLHGTSSASFTALFELPPA